MSIIKLRRSKALLFSLEGEEGTIATVVREDLGTAGDVPKEDYHVPEHLGLNNRRKNARGLHAFNLFIRSGSCGGRAISKGGKQSKIDVLVDWVSVGKLFMWRGT